MVWMAATGGFACMVSVIIALLAGMRYSVQLSRMPAATALEDVQGQLQVKREELERVEAESQRQREERNALKAELDGIIVRRKEEEARLRDIQEDLAKLDSRRVEIDKTRDELAEVRTQVAEVLSDLEKRRTEYNELVIAAERARTQIALLDERKAEIEALTTAERDVRARLAEAIGKLDYIDRQVTTARAETERLAAEQKKLLTESQSLEEKKIQLQSELAQLWQQRDPLAAELDKTRQELEAASEDLRSARKQRQEVQEELDQFRFMRASIEATTATTRIELETVQKELAKLKEEHQPLIAELDSLRREIATYRDRRRETEEELGSLYAARALAETAVSKAHDDLKAVQTDLAQLQPHKTELESLRRKIAEARDRLQNLDDEYDQTLARLKEIEKQIEEKLNLKQEIEKEIEEKRKTIQPIAKPTGSIEPETNSVLADLVRPPACLSDQNHPQPAASEQDSLQQVRQHLEALNLHFPERTLYAFHTALKIAPISPLTVLAGISGTGKSQLPRRYAEAMGVHFLKIPVQPRWDSPQDMLGFYNYLEKRYKATELARALVHFDPYNWPAEAKRFKDRLLLVLLDEMNLARVEYYFSEFLSQLEGRPGPDQPDMDGIHKSEITLDIGGASGRTCRIYPGHNMLFVGTMNEDESTQTLSDKVLDRANLLRFPRPNKLVEEASTEAGAPIDAYLPASRWHGWRRRFGELPDHLRSKITKLVHDLNSELDELHRPFAHRVNQAMLAYIANYPGVAEPSRRDGWESARLAFADQLEQRILPKLRGIDLGDASNSQPLRKIGEMIRDDLHDEALYAAFQQASQDDGSGRPFLWMGVRREEAA